MQDVELQTGPAVANAPPTSLPASLNLPARIDVAALQIGRLRVDQFAPVTDLGARVALGGANGHRIAALHLTWDKVRVDGDARIAAARPFALAAQWHVAPLSGEAFDATLTAGGTLERTTLDARLRGIARAGHATPAADVHAELQPFAAWPLAALSASTQALDLAALASSLPQTRLSGQVQVHSSALQAPITASVTLDNADPGRWDEGRLPLRHVALELAARAEARDRVELRHFELALGGAGANAAAGTWQGSGHWLKNTLQLASTLADVRPQRIDGRAAAMSLSGPLALTLQGLPSPDGSAAAAPLAVELKSTLDGRLDAAPQPVQLAIDVLADATHIDLRRLRASAGRAVAQGTASAERGAGDRWSMQSDGSLSDFDPLPWWPGEAGSAWRRGPHRISADWRLAVRLPVEARRLAPLALLQGLAGEGRLHVHDSLIAGLPLALDVTLGQTQGATSAHGTLQIAGNTLSVDGRGDANGSGAADRWQLVLDAPELGRLGPLALLSPATAAWAPRSGQASARLDAIGRWPALRTEGQATLARLEAGDLGVQTGSVRWNLDTGGDGERPLQLTAQLGSVHLGRQRAQQLSAELSGTLSRHRLLLSAALPITPPPAAEALFAMKPGSGTRAQLEADGSWSGDPAGGGRWRGHIAHLAVGTWDGHTLAGAPAADWLQADGLNTTLQFGAGGELLDIQADPGQLRAAGEVALRWDAVHVDLRGPRPNIVLRADLAPFAVAPLLARTQPTMGWSGDLTLAGHVDIRAAEKFDAELVLERQDGDLQIDTAHATQRLGLTQLRLAITAHDGEWVFTQALAGRSVGEIDGTLRAHTTPQNRWPGADAPIDGVLQAHVANLSIWRNWVPPGWQIGGELRTRAGLGGRFGAPEYTGELQGSGITVRNVLQGVSLDQGSLAIKLEGAAARIERFTLRGGDGTLTLSGGATFGSTPNATLKVDAERFRVLGRIDRQLIVSGSAQLGLRADEIKLDGGFKVDEGLFDISHGDAPSLDDDVVVQGPEQAALKADAAAAAAPPPRRNVAVAVEVDLGDKLRVRGRGLDTALRGRLRITTPGGRLAVQGQVSTDGGTYQAYGQKLDIARGVVAFSGAVDNPRLDILALRPNTDIDVGVAITGNLLTPRVRLYSDADLSDADKLSWLLLGRAPDGLGRSDTALLQRAAVALLAGEGGTPTDALIHSLGLDDLSVSQNNDTGVQQTVVSLGKQLSRRWYVGYERGVNATAGTWQLVYRLAQRFTLRAQSGAENAVDVIWTWKSAAPRPTPVPKSAPQPP